MGHTANTACCACNPETAPPCSYDDDYDYTYDDDYDYTYETYVPGPVYVNDGSCDEVEGWYDIDGPQFNCAWYAAADACAGLGDDYENEGYTANTACCACGGGTPVPV